MRNQEKNTIIKVAIVIPCFKVKAHILSVLPKTYEWADKVYVVDDSCPEKTGDFVEANVNDPRVVVIRNEKNLGVGGAVMAGYRAAINDGM